MFLVKPIKYIVIKRFYPITSIAILKNTGSVASERFLSKVEEGFPFTNYLFKSLSYLLRTYGISMMYNSTTKSLSLYNNKNKNLLTSIHKNTNIKNIFDDKEVVKYIEIKKNSQYSLIYTDKISQIEHNMGMSLVDFLSNNVIPIDNVSRLLLLQKLFPKLTFSRGLIHEYAIQYEQTMYKPEHWVGDRIFIENAPGIAIIDTMSEIVFNFDYLRYTNQMQNIRIISLIMLHTKDKTHPDAIESYKQTQQYNCDNKLKIFNKVTQEYTVIYLDIKQTESCAKDYQVRYLKYVDLDDEQTFINYFMFIKTSIKTGFTPEFFTNTDITIDTRLNKIHEWLLLQCNNYNIHTAFIFTKPKLYIDLNAIENDFNIRDIIKYSVISKETFTSDFGFNKTMHEIICSPYNYGVSKSLKDRLTDPKAITDNIGKTRHSRYLPEFMKHIDNDIPT
jgi:hypothetical protein